MVDIFDVSYTVFKEAATRYTVHYFSRPALDGYTLGTGNKDVVYTTNIVESSDVNDFINNLLLTADESEKEGDVLAKPTLSTQGNVQKQYDLTDPSFLYIGTAKPGVATSSIGWTIIRHALDNNGTVVDKKSTVADIAVWDDKILENYV